MIIGHSVPWSGASDEMNITWTYPMAKEMNRGSWNPKMLEGSSSQGTSYAMWWRYYEGIRQCNVFLENIDLCPAAQATKMCGYVKHVLCAQCCISFCCVVTVLFLSWIMR